MTTTNAQSFYNVCVAATHSGAGKTTITLGVLSALCRRGMEVQPFKCGPDYIDSGHHRRATGNPSRNLDTWMMTPEGVARSYKAGCQNTDVAVVEGVMGLYDGASPRSIEGSTAHVAQRLHIPIVLVVDAKAMARSIAALVKGYATFEPGVEIVGVIANNVSSDRHAEILAEALRAAELPPLLGSMPRREELQLPERHLGLIADTESGLSDEWYQKLAETTEACIDVDKMLAQCERKRPSVTSEDTYLFPAGTFGQEEKDKSVRLGIAQDEAFHFYYQDNLDMLQAAGVELVPFSPLHDTQLPHNLQGLYFGGGFPEMFGSDLAANKQMRDHVQVFAQNDVPVFAECGGLMYLSSSLIDADEVEHEMCRVIPVVTRMESRRRRLGYVLATTLKDGIFGPVGTKLRGHEFHWSSIAHMQTETAAAFQVQHPHKEGTSRTTGFRVQKVWASYIHLHFASNPDAVQAWVEALNAAVMR